MDNAAKGLFNLKGLIVTETNTADGKPISIDKATEDAIVAGAEEVREVEDEDGNIFEVRTHLGFLRSRRICVGHLIMDDIHSFDHVLVDNKYTIQVNGT